MTNFLHDIVSHYPSKAAIYEIGKSQGGELIKNIFPFLS